MTTESYCCCIPARPPVEARTLYRCQEGTSQTGCGAIRCISECDTMPVVTKAISVRLDDQALRALSRLEARGLSRSEAIRKALVDAADRLGRGKSLAAEVRALEADENDRRKMLEIAALMERLRAPG